MSQELRVELAEPVLKYYRSFPTRSLSVRKSPPQLVFWDGPFRGGLFESAWVRLVRGQLGDTASLRAAYRLDFYCRSLALTSAARTASAQPADEQPKARARATWLHRHEVGVHLRRGHISVAEEAMPQR